MKRFWLIALAVVTVFILVACSPTASTPAAPTEAPKGGNSSAAYPQPGATSSDNMNAVYPGNSQNPATGQETPYPSQPELIFGAIAGDENLTRAPFTVDRIEIKSDPNNPGQQILILAGNLPTPCHQARAVMSAPDASGKITVDAYSVASKDEVCTQVLKPYTGYLPFTGLAAGKYTVQVGDKSTDLTIQ